MTRGVNKDANGGGIDTQLFYCNLQCNGVDALTHFGPAVTNFDNAVGTKVHHSARDFTETVS